MKILPVLIAFLFAKVCHSQIIVINTGSSDDLYTISVIQNNILVGGFYSYLAKSYDECNTMIQIPTSVFTNSNLAFAALNRIDTNLIYITADDASGRGTIWKSANGGYNWLKKFDSTDVNYDLQVTKFFNAHDGITFISDFRTLRTHDGMNTHQFDSFPSEHPIKAAVYGDSTIVLGTCGVYCGLGFSRDQGHTWQNASPTYGLGQCLPIDIQFLNKDTAFSITSTQNYTAFFLRSFTGGQTWDEISFSGFPSDPQESFHKLCLKASDEIYIATKDNYTGYGAILKTTDLGQTWSRYTTPFKKNFYDMKFINDSVALICGEQGLLFKWNSKAAVFTGIKKNVLSECQVSVFPNPVQERLQIDVKGNLALLEVRVYNVLGQLVAEQKINGSQEISVLNLPVGLYSLKIRGDRAEKVFKLLKD